MSSTFQIPQPIENQSQFIDGKTGNLTEQGWWFLFSLRQGTITAGQNAQLNTVDLVPVNGIVIPDLSLSGPNGSFDLPASSSVVTINNPIFTGGTVPNGATITIYYDQGAIGGHPGPLFQTGLGGFSPDLNTLVIVETPLTTTTYVIGFNGKGWTLKSFQTGETTVPA